MKSAYLMGQRLEDLEMDWEHGECGSTLQKTYGQGGETEYHDSEGNGEYVDEEIYSTSRKGCDYSAREKYITTTRGKFDAMNGQVHRSTTGGRHGKRIWTRTQ